MVDRVVVVTVGWSDKEGGNATNGSGTLTYLYGHSGGAGIYWKYFDRLISTTYICICGGGVLVSHKMATNDKKSKRYGKKALLRWSCNLLIYES